MPRETSIDLHFSELDDLIGRWRRATVPVATKGVPPHITLLYPWKPAPLADADVERLGSVIERRETFSLRFTGVERFPRARALYLAVKESAKLRRVMQSIFSAFPDTPPYKGAFPDPVPHVTIAKAVDDEELDALAEEIAAQLSPHLPIEVAVHDVVVMEEGEDSVWRTCASIPLWRIGGGADGRRRG
jgi:2'-5' RNA ligase